MTYDPKDQLVDVAHLAREVVASGNLHDSRPRIDILARGVLHLKRGLEESSRDHQATTVKMHTFAEQADRLEAECKGLRDELAKARLDNLSAVGDRVGLFESAKGSARIAHRALSMLEAAFHAGAAWHEETGEFPSQTADQAFRRWFEENARPLDRGDKDPQ